MQQLESTRRWRAASFQMALRLFPLLLAFWLPAQEEEVLVGQNSVGQLQVRIEFTQPLELPPSIFPGISGYATGLLGFHSAALDEPENDFYQLSTEADFRFILITNDPGMEVWNDHGSAFMTNGEMFFVGPAPFDTHPIWNLLAGSPGVAYSLTLQLRDLNGIYPDGAPFTLSFTVAPDPGPFQLAISPGPRQVSLTWPTNAIGWILESNSDLANGNWGAITNLPAVVETNYALTLPALDAQQFFRLRMPGLGRNPRIRTFPLHFYFDTACKFCINGCVP
jgi:hypothetical protein